MIESAAPIPHLPEIVAAATQAVGDIVFDAKLGQGAEHDHPRLLLIDEVRPVAIIDGYFNAFISAEFDKLGKIPDRRLTVVIIGESLNAVNADVKNGAADYGSEGNEILIVSLSLGDNIAALVKAVMPHLPIETTLTSYFSEFAFISSAFASISAES